MMLYRMEIPAFGLTLTEENECERFPGSQKILDVKYTVCFLPRNNFKTAYNSAAAFYETTRMYVNPTDFHFRRLSHDPRRFQALTPEVHLLSA